MHAQAGEVRDIPDGLLAVVRAEGNLPQGYEGGVGGGGREAGRGEMEMDTKARH